MDLADAGAGSTRGHGPHQSSSSSLPLPGSTPTAGCSADTPSGSRRIVTAIATSAATVVPPSHAHTAPSTPWPGTSTSALPTIATATVTLVVVKPAWS